MEISTNVLQLRATILGVSPGELPVMSGKLATFRDFNLLPINSCAKTGLGR